MEQVRDTMALMGGKAMRGLLSNFVMGRIYAGRTGLLLATNYLDAVLGDDARRVLFIADDFTRKFVDAVTAYLSPKGIECRVWAGVQEEAPLPTVQEGARACAEFQPGALVAIGGGSVIDTAKLVFVAYERPDQDLLRIQPYFTTLGLHQKVKCFVAIPTTSGTGSEVTGAAVVTNLAKDPPKKYSLTSDEMVPDVVVLDTDFVKDLPRFLTMASGLDAFSHAVGAYAGNWGNPLTDALNLAAIAEILAYLPRAVRYGKRDLEARAHMQLGALMAGAGFGNAMAGIDHALGHAFGKIFHVHHGVAVALFTPYALAFEAEVSDRWRGLCPAFHVDPVPGDRTATLHALVGAITDFVDSVGGPTCIREVQRPVIPESEFRAQLDLTAHYAYTDMVALTSYRPMREADFKRILEYAWDGRVVDF